MRIRRLIVVVMALLVVSCGNQEEIDKLTDQAEALQAKLTIAEQEVSDLKSDMSKLRDNYDQIQFLAKKLEGIKARIVTNYGSIELKFFPEKAPIHCFNFISRAESGYYNGTQFHRVMKGFMIQGGDPNSRDDNPADDGQGGPIVNIPHEFNDIKHVPGVLSMARVPTVSAGAGSQFFIMHGTNHGLDNKYTAFGEVTKGMDVVNEITEVPLLKPGAGPANHPVKPVRILRVDVYR